MQQNLIEITDEHQAQRTSFEKRPDVDAAALARALSAPAVCVDIETNTKWPGVGPKSEYGLSYCTHSTTIAFAWRQGDEMETTAVAADHQGTFDPFVIEALHKLFKSTATIIAHNAIFDIRILSRLVDGLTPVNVWCTLVMSRLLPANPLAGGGLGEVAESWGLTMTPAQKAMKKQRSNMHAVPVKEKLLYAQDDARLAFEIYEKQQAAVDSDLMWSLVDWECRVMREYCRMSARGMLLNREYVKQRLLELDRLCRDLSAALQADGLGIPGDGASQVRYLYGKKGVPKPTWTPKSIMFTKKGHAELAAIAQAKGKVTADDIQLEYLSGSTKALSILLSLDLDDIEADENEDSDEDESDTEIEEVPTLAHQLETISAYIYAANMRRTLQGLLDHAQADGRIHSMVAPGTDTGRRSAKNPQVQNLKLKVKSKYDTSGTMAGVLIGDPDFTLVEIDYSNAEKRISATLSRDDAMAAACMENDFHAAMAAIYYGDHFTNLPKGCDEWDTLRNLSKIVTFGTDYGMGAATLAHVLGISRREAEALLAAKDRAFPKIKEAKKQAKLNVDTKGFVTLWTKRKVTVRNRGQSFKAWDYCCQGGVSEMIKRSLVLISEAFAQAGMRSHIVLDMHDALILAIAHDEWDEALKIASDIMEGVMPEKLNRGTTPAMVWIAQPDFKKNAGKWGKFQWHPEKAAPAAVKEIDWTMTAINGVGTVVDFPDEYPSGPDAYLAHCGLTPTPDQRDEFIAACQAAMQDEQAPVMPTEIPDLLDVQVIFEDIHFSYPLHEVRLVPASQLNDHEKVEFRKCADALWDALDTEFSKKIMAIVPQPVSGVGIEFKAVQGLVDLNNYAKVPANWLAALQRAPGLDLVALTGYSAAQFEEEAVSRKAYVEMLSKRLEWCSLIWEVCSENNN